LDLSFYTAVLVSFYFIEYLNDKNIKL
jgi:hypothetical protein